MHRVPDRRCSSGPSQTCSGLSPARTPRGRAWIGAPGADDLPGIPAAERDRGGVPVLGCRRVRGLTVQEEDGRIGGGPAAVKEEVRRSVLALPCGAGPEDCSDFPGSECTREELDLVDVGLRVERPQDTMADVGAE